MIDFGSATGPSALSHLLSWRGRVLAARLTRPNHVPRENLRNSQTNTPAGMARGCVIRGGRVLIDVLCLFAFDFRWTFPAFCIAA